jgi:hypothetical protein
MYVPNLHVRSSQDLEIYEAIQETGEIDILRPKRSGTLGQAICCDDELFLDFLQTVLQINPIGTPPILL